MSFVQKCRFFSYEYGVFLFFMLIIALVSLLILCYFCYNQSLIIEDMDHDLGELKKLCDKFSQIAQEAQEERDKQLKELERRLSESYSLALIPKFRGLHPYIYPLFKDSFGSIERPDFYSFNKNYNRTLRQPPLPYYYYTPKLYSKWALNQRIEKSIIYKNYRYHLIPDHLYIHVRPLDENDRY